VQSQRTGGSDSEDSEEGFLRRREEEDHHSMDSDEEPLPTINNRAPPSFPSPLSPQLDHGEGTLSAFIIFVPVFIFFNVNPRGFFYYEPAKEVEVKVLSPNRSQKSQVRLLPLPNGGNSSNS
jgi:hypothetical protein